MKQKVVLGLVFVLICPASPAPANIARPVKEVLEAVIKRCRVCREVFSSPAAERLVKRGIIKAENADDVARFLNRFGDDGLRILDNYGDDALRVFRRYGDEGMSHLKQYGDEYLSLLRRESPEAVNKILKHPKGMVFIRENPDFVKHYGKYGDDLLKCVNKNPLCVESVQRTGLAPRIISGLKEKNVTWLEAHMLRLDPKDAEALQKIVRIHGDGAMDFIRRNQDILLKAGVFSLVAVNFDEVLAGGRQVLEKTVETAGATVKEVVTKTATETAKATTQTLGGSNLFYLLLLLSGFFILCSFGYLLIRQKMKGRRQSS